MSIKFCIFSAHIECFAKNCLLTLAIFVSFEDECTAQKGKKPLLQMHIKILFCIFMIHRVINGRCVSYPSYCWGTYGPIDLQRKKVYFVLNTSTEYCRSLAHRYISHRSKEHWNISDRHKSHRQKCRRSNEMTPVTSVKCVYLSGEVLRPLAFVAYHRLNPKYLHDLVLLQYCSQRKGTV